MKPHFHRPHSIPYALRSRVDQALGILVSDGIMEAIQFSEWAAPTVPVVKRDGSIRVCGEYKLTINQVALVDTYPLPLVQDILASLANGKSFTQLDLALAYQQLVLDEESRPYTQPSTCIEEFFGIHDCLWVWLPLLPFFNVLGVPSGGSATYLRLSRRYSRDRGVTGYPPA